MIDIFIHRHVYISTLNPCLPWMSIYKHSTDISYKSPNPVESISKIINIFSVFKIAFFYALVGQSLLIAQLWLTNLFIILFYIFYRVVRTFFKLICRISLYVDKFFDISISKTIVFFPIYRNMSKKYLIFFFNF